ncbi:hypothetical protein [Sulfitobacter sp. SH24]|uniref:hypothetical protein n=1 Tax=Sulfitobacter sp. SH24 TaxID=3421173 RepID=UPI003F50609E
MESFVSLATFAKSYAELYRYVVADDVMGTIYIILSLVISISWLALRNKLLDLGAGLVAGNIFFALIPMTLAPYLGEIVAEGLAIDPFISASPSLGLYAFLFSVSIVLATEVSRMVKPRRVSARGSAEGSRAPNAGEFRTVFLYATGCLIIVFISSGKLSGAHWAAHADAGFIGALVGLFALSFRAYIFAISIAVMRSDPKKVMVLLIVFTALDVVLTGNRITVLYLVFAVLFSGAFGSVTLAIMAVTAAPPAYFLAVLYPAFRGVVWSQFGGFSGFEAAFWYVWHNGAPASFEMSGLYALFEAANVVIFQYIFETFGRTHEFLNGETVVVKPLTFFIPRELWPSKPLGLGTRLGVDVFGVYGLSLNSLLMGEFYANFGWFAPVMMFLLTAVLSVLSNGNKALQDPRYQLTAFILAFSAWRHEFNYIVFGFIVAFFVIGITRKMAKKNLN